MYCSKCGSNLQDGVKFCPKCGTPVGAENRSASTNMQAQSNPQVIVIEDKEKEEATPLQHTIGTVVLVIGIIALITLFFNMVLAFILGVGGDILGAFAGKSTIAKTGQGICGFVTGACILIWILAAIGIASCLGYF